MMQQKYVIKKTTADINWDEMPEVSVNFSPWAEFSSPYNTYAQVVYDDIGLYVHLKTDEKFLRAVNTEKNSDVCDDSCMEFFFSPDAEDTRYFNIEINPIGTMLVYVSDGRDNFNKIDFSEELFDVKSIITVNGWELYYKVPFSFIRKHFNKITNTMYGNFYKCGNKTIHEHYACWNPIEIEFPEFHCRSYFGKLVFKDEE